MSPTDPHDTPLDAPPDDRVRLSLSEINALCFRAARGAGLEWGEAEEAGWAASWLSGHGLSGPSIILAWLDAAPALARPCPAPGHWAAASAPHCPLRCGIALADFAGLAEGPGAHALTLEQVAHPLIVLPFVARAATRVGASLRVQGLQHAIVLSAADMTTRGDLTGINDSATADLAITAVAAPQDATDAQAAPVPIRGITRADWRALDGLALRMTVPSSDQSRAGAGAAGSDND